MGKSTIVVEGTFREGYEEVFDEYSVRVRAYLERHGGQVVRRQRILRTLYGTQTPSLIMIIDFPSEEIAGRIFFEKDYLDILPLRERVFSDFKMYLAAHGDI